MLLVVEYMCALRSVLCLQKKRTIDDETTFCDERVLSNILSSKVSSVEDNQGVRRSKTSSM